MRIEAYSSAGVTNWLWLPNDGVLFDCGDGFLAFAGSDAGSVRNVFLTHKHRDHTAGVMALKKYSGAHGGKTTVHQAWKAPDRPSHIELHDGAIVEIGLNKFVEAFATEHKGEAALGYRFVVGDKTRLIYTGDTAPLDPRVYEGADMLVHECTSISPNEETERRGHSSLPEVIDVAERACVRRLLLFHLPDRADWVKWRKAIRKARSKWSRLAVDVVWPGEIYTSEVR